MGLDSADIERHGWVVVIGRKGRGFEGEGQTAGPTGKAGPLPPSNESVGDPVGSAEYGLSATNGQHIDPVGGDQAARVKVRDSLVELGVPGVLDGEVGEAVVDVAEDVGALGLGPKVERFGESVADIDRQTMRGRMTQGKLQ